VSEGQGKRSRAASIGNADLLAPAEENWKLQPVMWSEFKYL
jgi:hypothetical protein